MKTSKSEYISNEDLNKCDETSDTVIGEKQKYQWKKRRKHLTDDENKDLKNTNGNIETPNEINNFIAPLGSTTEKQSTEYVDIISENTVIDRVRSVITECKLIKDNVESEMRQSLDLKYENSDKKTNLNYTNLNDNVSDLPTEIETDNNYYKQLPECVFDDSKSALNTEIISDKQTSKVATNFVSKSVEVFSFTPKNANFVENDSVTFKDVEDSSSLNIKSKPTRGRKRKVIDYAALDSGDILESNAIEDLPFPLTSKIKRKVGRPRKHNIEILNATNCSSDDFRSSENFDETNDNISIFDNTDKISNSKIQSLAVHNSTSTKNFSIIDENKTKLTNVGHILNANINSSAKKRGNSRKRIITEETSSLENCDSNMVDYAALDFGDITESNAVQDLPFPVSSKIKRKLGRPRKHNIESTNVTNCSSADRKSSENFNETNGNINVLVNTDKTGNSINHSLDVCGNTSSENLSTINEVKTNSVGVGNILNTNINSPVKKRGRSRKKNIAEETCIKNYDSNNSSSVNESSLTNIQNNNYRTPLVGDVTCAICSSKINIKKWKNHKESQHNNLAWMVGEEEIDLSDQNLVTRILTLLVKKKKKLRCSTCNETKKSAVGFFSHQMVCNKSISEIENIKVTCDLCKRTMLPVSVEMHKKFCLFTKTSKDIPQNETAIQEDSNKSKRSAAVKANNLIQAIAKDGEIVDKSLNPINKKSTLKRFYFKNFDFRETYYIKRLFDKWEKKEELVRCLFEKCDLQFKEVNEAIKHLPTCDFKPEQGYTCKFCIITFKSEEEIENHLHSIHSKKAVKANIYEDGLDSTDEEEDSNCKTELKQLKSKRQSYLVKTNVKFLKVITKKCIPAKDRIPFEWTLRFYENNYTESNLFPHLAVNLSDWPIVDKKSLVSYTPMLNKSVNVAYKTVNGYVNTSAFEPEWQQFSLFENKISTKGHLTTFIGGPIQSLAWAPTPFHENDADQILAVSVFLDPDKQFFFHNVYDSPGLIQFWNYGCLKNDTQLTNTPQFMFSIAHDYGIVWHMEWCPSGCYDLDVVDEIDKNAKRLGLLAVCCADSFVYMYSIPQTGQLRPQIYKPVPILKLQMNLYCIQNLGKSSFHATKTSWSKTAGHKYVAVGYSNGMVAIFNLNTKSKLLTLGKDEKNIPVLLPYKTFQAHCHCITALSLHHMNNGNRWLMTGSIDRLSKFWDLEDVRTPLTSLRKHVITDGVWLNNWIGSVFAFDDATANGVLPTTIHQARNYLCEVTPLLYSSSTVRTLSGSDWLNGIMQGTASGEMLCIFPPQLFSRLDCDKSLKKCRLLLNYVGLVEKENSVEERLKGEKRRKKNLSNEEQHDIHHNYEPLQYFEAAEKYGVVFCDLETSSYKCFKDKLYEDVSGKVNKLISSQPNIYPLQSVNKVALNPNKQAYLYFAAGYQAGFLRVNHLSFLNAKK